MRNILLRHAIPLIRTHGFTRQALSLAALSLPTPHTEPLSETAVSALFGPGDEARRTLIKAWLGEGIDCMGRRDGGERVKGSLSVRDALRQRLEWNVPVIEYLPEAFALLSVPQTISPVPMDILPAIAHPFSVANEACFLSADASIGTSWYTERASIAFVYTATELHQLTSPPTAPQFLDTLLTSSDRAREAIASTGEFANYIWRGWAGIIKSRGFV